MTEDRDYVAEQVDSDTYGILGVNRLAGSKMRCVCGILVSVEIPTRCKGCKQAFPYWKPVGRTPKHLADMDLGHLTNCVRFIAARAEKFPAEFREDFEIALDMLYLEISKRGKEINQQSGILRAIQNSFKST